ncbi:MAG: acetylglutamate kinase [Spirochaetaceae bacterium]|nr:acetylglutamate kinase [Spirochaetaceae bacterium]
MNTGSLIIKIGGGPARDRTALQALAAEIRTRVQIAASRHDAIIAIVHGGGADVSDLSRRLGIEPTFSDGIRMTGDDEMDVVDMILCGLVNKRLVRALTASGIRAVGISGADGALLVGTPVTDAHGVQSRTAHVSAVNPDIINRLWAAGYLPVIASPGADEQGGAVNINADEAAFALGGAIGAGAIVFLSDVPGVQGSDGEAIASLGIAEAERLVKEGTITGGMVAKIRSAAGAIAAGVHHIVIGSYERPGDLSRLVSGQNGTTIHGEKG